MRDRLNYNLRLKDKYVCDRCGKTCVSTRNNHKILDENHVIALYTDNLFSHLELCDKCQEEFALFWNKKRKQRIKGFSQYDAVTQQDWEATTPRDIIVKARAEKILNFQFGFGEYGPRRREEAPKEIVEYAYELAENQTK